MNIFDITNLEDVITMFSKMENIVHDSKNERKKVEVCNGTPHECETPEYKVLKKKHKPLITTKK